MDGVMPDSGKRTWYPKHHKFIMVDVKCFHHMSMSPEEKTVEEVLSKYLGIHSNLISPEKWRKLREELGRLIKPEAPRARKTAKAGTTRSHGKRR